MQYLTTVLVLLTECSIHKKYEEKYNRNPHARLVDDDDAGTRK